MREKLYLKKRFQKKTSFLKVLSAACFLGSSRKVNYTAESDIRFGGILVFISAGTCLQVISNIFPASTTNYFTLHQRGIIIFCIPANIRVHIMLKVSAAFVINRSSPFRYISRHTIQPKIIWLISICTNGIESAIFRIITTARLKV